MSNNIDVLIEKYIGKDKVYKLKDRKGNRFETTLPPEKRTLENKPKEIKVQNWMQLSKSPELYNGLSNVSWGWSANGSAIGWSHRAQAEFKIGDKIRRDSIGNNYNEEFTINKYKEAEEMAKKFANEIS